VRLRFVTFNVRSFRAGWTAVRDVLADLAPDVILLQECRSGRVAVRLADALGMEGVTSHRPFSRVRNGVLYRAPWRVTELDVRKLSREGRTLRRGFVAAHLWQPGVRLTAVSVHLGLSDRERERHARELTDLLSVVEGPTVLGVDLNEGPAGAAARWIAGRFYDSFGQAGEGSGETFPAEQPTARIDFLFVSDELKVERSWVPDSGPVSDHRPVVADAELPGP
jgi:endonuclease/exonuclease/phosphatase family metal-dependent hydrolase